MKHISIGLIFLLVVEISPLSVAFAEEHEKVIVISEEVGEVIDKEEREQYALFPQIEGFKSAIFLQLPDGSYVVEVTSEENGEEKTTRILQSEIAIKSLKSYIKKVSEGEIKPELFDVRPKHQETEKAAVYLEKAIVEKPPISSGKITAEIFGGIGAGALLGIGAGAIGALIADGESRDAIISPEALGAIFGFVIAYPIGSAIGVYVIGNTGNETGSFAATLGGGLVGVGVGIGTIALGPLGYISFLCPPIGSTIGFNATRRCRNPSPAETGLINYRDSRLSLAVPSIYYTQKNTLEGKTITQNVTLVRITF